MALEHIMKNVKSVYERGFGSFCLFTEA